MSSLLRNLDASREMVQYDTHVKRVLSDKSILAWILKGVVREFSDYSVEEIRTKYIEDNICISEIPVAPGLTNKSRAESPERVLGDNTEDSVPGEGTIYFDIRFHAWVPSDTSGEEKKQMMKLLLNIEAQKSFYPGYEVVTRGVFYAARMVSAQLDTEFSTDDYDGIKKVYSIWLCMDTPLYMKNAIAEYHMVKTDR